MEIDGSLHERFFRWIDEKHINQVRVARVLGVSSGTISQYKAQKYVGNMAALESKIHAYLQREASRADVQEVLVMDLSATRKVLGALAIAHAQREIAVVVGDAGTGKTTAMREYVQSTLSAVLIETDPSYTPHTLVMATARALGVGVSGTASMVSEMIVERLRGSDMLIMYDEADYLPASSLEWIRRIVHDKGGCGVVLSGLPRLEHLLRNVRGDHDQLLSRIGVYVSVGRAGIADARKIVRAIWKGADRALVEAVCKESRGSLRRTVKLVQLAGRLAKNNGEDMPSVVSVQDAVGYVMPERLSRMHQEAMVEEEVA